MSLGILGEDAKSLFASSPCTHKSFPCYSEYVSILSAHTETILCTANNPNLPYSPYTLKYFLRILRICLDTFPSFPTGA